MQIKKRKFCLFVNLRGANLLSLPRVNGTKYGLKCFRYYAVKYWNVLPDNMRILAGTKEFVSKGRGLIDLAF